jgi:membrane protein implicated in regulation of membrane protease activity
MKPATNITVILLMLIAIFRVEIVANGMIIPMWASVLAFIIPAVLAIMVWRENRDHHVWSGK